MATKNPTTRILPAQDSPTERINQDENNCPHGIPVCPVCAATDELLRIVRAPKPRLFGLFGGAR